MEGDVIDDIQLHTLSHVATVFNFHLTGQKQVAKVKKAGSIMGWGDY